MHITTRLFSGTICIEITSFKGEPAGNGEGEWIGQFVLPAGCNPDDLGTLVGGRIVESVALDDGSRRQYEWCHISLISIDGETMRFRANHRFERRA